MRRPLAILVAATALLAAGAGPAQAALPHINHVFIVVLENEDGDVTFGPDSRIPYLSQTMRSQGAYLPNYYATGHLSLDNYISMVSGQAPNPQTQADCITFTDFIALSGPDADGQFVNPLGGCVYPPQVQTIANQLEAAGLTWRGYVEDMAAKAPAEPASCRHPDIGAVDDTQTAEAGISTRPGTTRSSTSTRSSTRRAARRTTSTSPSSAPTSPRRRPRRTTASSPRTSATTATTSPASTGSRAG